MTIGENVSPSPDTSPNSARSFDQAWAAVALVGTTTSAAVAIAYCLLRVGLVTPVLLPLACLLVVAAVLFGPLLLPATGALQGTRFRGILMPLVALVLLLAVVAGFWFGPIFLVFYAAVAIAGIVRGIALLSGKGARPLLGLVLLGLFLAIYLFFTVHSMGYAGVTTPEQALLGTLNHDTTIHAAIAYLIQNFGTPSLGLDGILPIRYHFGTHIWFAAIGALSGAEPVWSYGAGVPIVAAPLLVAAFALAAVSIDGGGRSWRSYLLVALGLLLISDFIGWKSYYISESYTFALIGLLLVLPILADFARLVPLDRLTVLGMVAAVLVIPVLVLFKTSVGILWCAAFGWVVFRRFVISRVTIILGLAAAIALVGVLLQTSPGVDDYKRFSDANMSITPLYFFVLYPSVQAYACLLLPLCLLLLRITGAGGTRIRELIATRADLVLEAVLLVTVIGTIPPLIGVPKDGAVWYFYNVAQWIAMPFLVVRIAPVDFGAWLASFRASRLAAPAAAVLVFLALSATQTIYTTTFESLKSVVTAANRRVDGQLLQGRTETQYFVQSILRSGGIWGPDFQQALAASPGSQLRQVVREMTGSPRQNVAVFIPPANTAFWTMHEPCIEKHNVQVSLTGQPSLLGGPPRSFDCAFDAYTTPYGDDYFSKEASDQELCDRARSRGIRQVIILSETVVSDHNRVLDCPAT